MVLSVELPWPGQKLLITSASDIHPDCISDLLLQKLKQSLTNKQAQDKFSLTVASLLVMSLAQNLGWETNLSVFNQGSVVTRSQCTANQGERRGYMVGSNRRPEQPRAAE